jgi:3',5'-cyclic AMP phosphodiesterase CpdA
MEKIFERALVVINSLKPLPDVVVHSGDLTDHGVYADYKFAKKKD